MRPYVVGKGRGNELRLAIGASPAGPTNSSNSGITAARIRPPSELVNLPVGTEVLVAGVRRATHTPPMRSGKRVVFLSLDDGSGPVSNVVFFHDAQAAIGASVFRTHYALIRGRTRRTGARGVSVTGEQMWDLLDVAVKVRARQAAERERELQRVVVEAEAADNVIQMWRRRA